MKRRIIKGLGANFFGMAIVIAIQVMSLPIFLHFWNLEIYGKWLILSAIPSYLSMADVGILTAAGNKMTMAMGKNDPIEANKIFQSAQAFMIIVSVVLVLLVLSVVLFLPLPWVESIDQRIALATMSMSVVVGFYGGLNDAAFKATDRYAFAAMLNNYIRLGEWLGSILGVILIGNFAAVAIGAFVIKLLGCVTGMVLINRTSHTLIWGLKFAQFSELKSMIKPAISFMAFPLGNLLSLQGTTLLVAAMFGPVSVALFSTYRTIARVAVQFTAILSHVLWPEFSKLFGQAAYKAITTLYLRASLMGGLQAIFLSLVLYFTSPLLLKIWTHDAIHFESSLMLFMLVYAAISGTWHIPRVMLMSINQHVNLSIWALFSGFLSVVLSWGLSQFYGLTGVIVGLGLSELVIAVVCIYLASQFIYANQRLSQVTI